MARRRSGRKIDNLRWGAFNNSFLATGAGASGAIVLTTIVGVVETIMRTRGNLVAWIDGLEAPAVGVIVSCGLIVVPEGTGSTVTWDPAGDPNAPWFWYESFVLGYEEYVADVIDCPGLSSHRSIIDSKAMRRWPQDSEIQFVMTNTTLAGAASVNVSIDGRILFGS